MGAGCLMDHNDTKNHTSVTNGLSSFRGELNLSPGEYALVGRGGALFGSKVRRLYSTTNTSVLPDGTRWHRWDNLTTILEALRMSGTRYQLLVVVVNSAWR